MKKITVTAIAVYAFVVITACATNKDSAVNTVTLDQAIQEASKDIEDNVQAGQKIAVLNFTSPSEQFSEYVLKELSDRLVNGRKLVVVDRNELDLIRQEENFQLSGEVSDESAQAIGKKLGAQLIVSGSIDAIGNIYRFRVRTLAVETAAVETSYSADVAPKETRVVSLLGNTKPATAQTDSASPNFMFVEGGTFQMGSDDSDWLKPAHTVTITSFYMGKYEVTQKEWKAVMGWLPIETFVKGNNLPVDGVTWYEAIKYCNRLSKKEGLTPVYKLIGLFIFGNNRIVAWNRNANGYRLPTEAEWEYAARGGNGSPGNYRYSGSNTADEVAWHKGNSGGIVQEVGAKKPNGLGLYDMSGNVREWCWDWFDRNYYSNSPQNDPIGASSGSQRVWRGEYWGSSADSVGSKGRSSFPPRERLDGLGFRLARNGQ